MKTFTYEDMRNNYEVIKEMCAKYRMELTATAGVICDNSGLVDCYEYVKFMQGLTDEEFTGNYMTTLLLPAGIDAYKKILNGEWSYYDYIEEVFGEDTASDVIKVLEHI